MKFTPMMQQYLDLKQKNPDYLLMFRLGDFYEFFFDDARLASSELELTLTGRDCGQEERAPMCGVPYHSVESYIQRLVQKGYKVAICEQTGGPRPCQGAGQARHCAGGDARHHHRRGHAGGQPQQLFGGALLQWAGGGAVRGRRVDGRDLRHAAHGARRGGARQGRACQIRPRRAADGKAGGASARPCRLCARRAGRRRHPGRRQRRDLFGLSAGAVRGRLLFAAGGVRQRDRVERGGAAAALPDRDAAQQPASSERAALPSSRKLPGA